MGPFSHNASSSLQPATSGCRPSLTRPLPALLLMLRRIAGELFRLLLLLHVRHPLMLQLLDAAGLHMLLLLLLKLLWVYVLSCSCAAEQTVNFTDKRLETI